MTAKKKPPVLWVVVCTDVDGKRYVFEKAYTRENARMAASIWRKQERCKRRYTVVRYLPSPGKKRGRR